MATVATHRPSKAIISLEAIRHNIMNERKRLHPDTALWAVVKADAYGHGLLPVAEAAREAGVDGFCVAYLDEAIALRQADFHEMVLVLGATEPKNTVVLAAKLGISLTAPSLDWLQVAAAILEQNGLTLRVHLAVDTGMGRIGVTTPEELKQCYDFVSTHQCFIKEGIFTHFATADEVDTAYFEKQKKAFEMDLIAIHDDFTYIHTANTATALWHDAWHSNAVRFGIGLYGMNPSGTVIEAPYTLEPAMRVETEIVFIKELPKGKSVSYGATYTTKENEWIATLPIGYADGFVRRYTGFEVLVDGNRCPIVGRVCMDQMMIRLPKYYPIGTKVVIVGESGDERNTFEMAAEHIGTINYELTCLLGERLERVYES